MRIPPRWRICLSLCCGLLGAGGLFSDEAVFDDDLTEGASSWDKWAPRNEISPVFSFDASVGRTSPGSLRITGHGDAERFGAWKQTLKNIEPGKLYRFEAWYRAEGIKNEARSVIPRLHWLNDEGRQARPPDFATGSTQEGDWTKVEYLTDALTDASELQIQLGFGFAPKGRLWWDDISITQVAESPSRLARIATIHHRARKTQSVQENRDQYLALIDQAAKQKPDIICLPEGMTTVGNPLSYIEVSESVPGPTTQQLGEAAKRHGCYIVAGLYERVGDVVYNTGVLIDRDGKLAGSYRKTHLPREEWEGGITPGDTYPVFDTDFGKIGIMICWDAQFPEPARALAQQGAELILLPIWGGSDVLTRARAIENHVFLVSSSYSMRSFVIDPTGEIIAEATDDNPISLAEVNLDQQYFQEWLGNMKHRTWKERRPDISTGR